MVFAFVTSIVGFIFFNMKYQSDLKQIRLYLKKNDHEMYTRHSLDALSLFFGTEDVEWEAQKFILKKRYLEYSDSVFAKMCEKAHNNALLAIICFIIMFIVLIFNQLF